MSSWTEHLDESLSLVSSRGRYHTLLFYLLCFPAAIPTGFLVFTQVFVSATPDHWCQPPPGLKTLNLTEEQIKTLTIPYTMNKDGSKSYSKCSMYDLDYGPTSPKMVQNGDDDETAKEMNGEELSSVDDVLRRFGEYVEAVGYEDIRQVECKYGWYYDRQQYERTLVTDYNLVCDQSWWPRTTTTLFWVGSLFGNVMFGWISDKWGRRPTLMLLLALEIPISLITCFSPDYISYTVLRTIGGLFFPALYQIPLILALELMPPTKRTHSGIMISAFFAMAMSLLAGLAYLTRDWFKLSLVTTVPFVALFSYYWIIPESPRWLVSKGRIREAEQVLIEIAARNGIVLKRGFLYKLHLEGKRIEEITVLHNFSSKSNEKYADFSKELEDDNECKVELVYNKSEKVIREPYTRANFLALTENMKKINEDDVETNSIDEGIQIEMREVKGTNAADEASHNLDGGSRFVNSDNKKEATDADVNGTVDSFASLQKATQTEPYTCSTNPGFRTRSLDFVTKLLGKESNTLNASKERLDEECSDIEREATPLDIFRNPNIRKKFFILTFDWIANGVVYNGLSYNASNLGVSDYLAFFIGGIVELPSYVIIWYLMDRFGRKWVLCGAMAMAGLACFSCMFVPEDKVWVTVALAMTGKFGVAGAFGVFYVFVGELFPTALRSQAMGLASFISGIGLLAAPYIAYLAVYWRALPLIIMGLLQLFGSFVSIFLPETLHAPLPQTVKEGEEFGKDHPVFDCNKARNKTKR